MTIENETVTAVADTPAQPETNAAETPATEETRDWGDAFDSDLKAIYAKNNPERDEAGKFTAAETPQPEQEIQDQPQTEVKEPEVPAIQPPVSWSAEAKEVWAALPPAAQEYVAKREREAHEQISRQGQELSQLQPLRQTVEQNADVFQRNNVSPDQGIALLLNAERRLAQDPYAAIAEIAQSYGVDLGAYSANQQPGTVEHALRQQIISLEQRLNETSSRIEQREALEAQTQQKTVMSEIEKFATGKSDWAELEEDILAELIGMGANIDAGILPDMSAQDRLAKAYERAQRNNPQVWEKKQAEIRKAEDEKRVAEAQKRAEDAKRSKVVNINSQAASGKSISTMDDDLRVAFRKAQSR